MSYFAGMECSRMHDKMKASSVCLLPEVVYLKPHCSNSICNLESCMEMSFSDTIDLWVHSLRREVSVCISHGDERWNNDAVVCFNELTWTGYAAAL